MEIIFHGQSTIEIVASGGSLIIDPFISGNGNAPVKVEQIKTDYVLLTHAHMDHILDAAPIAKANNIPVVSNPELASYMSWQGVEKTIGMNIGGTLDLGFAKVKMVHAFHSSGIVDEEKQQILYGGMPAGYLIYADGLTILNTGDTGLFGDMKLIGDTNDIDVVFLPIGDHYTMGPEDAAQAAQWYNAKLAVPVHYNTFPVIEQDGHAFVQLLETKGLKGEMLEPGDKLSF